MSDHEILDIYAQLLPFLAEVFGKGCEFVLHDISNPAHSLIAISNAASGRSVGDPMTDLATSLKDQEDYLHAPYVLNYKGQSKNKQFLSSTYFIKNGDRLIGMLCVNKDTSIVRDLNASLQHVLEQFNINVGVKTDFTENLETSTSVNDVIQTYIQEMITESGLNPKRMSKEEKISLIHRMNDIGLLSVKGAKEEIANLLSISVPTIYRYLNTDV